MKKSLVMLLVIALSLSSAIIPAMAVNVFGVQSMPVNDGYKDSDLDTALNVEGGTLTFSTMGVNSWVADGSYARTSNQGMPDSYGMVSTTVTMYEGQTLSFRYSVSSEEENDTLTFMSSSSAGLVIETWSGEVRWSTYTLTASVSGEYSLNWIYSKNDSIDGYDDTAYLDDIALSAFTPSATPEPPTPTPAPLTLNDVLNVEGGTLDFFCMGMYQWVPERTYAKSGNNGIPRSSCMLNTSVDMVAGQTLTFKYLVSSQEDFDSLSFIVNHNPLETWSGDTGWLTYTFTAESTENYFFSWIYTKDDSVDDLLDSAYIDDIALGAAPTPPPLTLNDVLNVEGGTLDFFCMGMYQWIPERTYAKSGNNGIPGSFCMLNTSVDMVAGQTLTFKYLVSSQEGFDSLTFSVNHNPLETWSGDTGWLTYTYTAEEAGNYFLSWTYRKDDSVDALLDTAYLDDIALGAAPQYQMGDANTDGNVNTGDAAYVLRSLIGLGELSELQRAYADVNGDATVNSGDAAMILEMALA